MRGKKPDYLEEMSSLVDARPSEMFHSAYVAQLSELLIKRADQLLSRVCHLTFSQFKVLFLLHHQGELSQQAIAACLKITPAAISRLSDNLVAKKYVQRQENPDNRRENKVSLTSAGQKQIEEAIEVLGALEQQLYDRLPKVRRELFLETIKELISYLTVEPDQEKVTSLIKKIRHSTS
jgi:DNA-binding MarR family transcriptional regulator